jgi:hypothetical protein
MPDIKQESKANNYWEKRKRKIFQKWLRDFPLPLPLPLLTFVS